MNRISLTTIMTFLLFTSCEKVIQIDLNKTDPKLIVEANLTDEPGPYNIILSHSVNYYDANIFPYVTGANITVSDNAGNSETLTEVNPGNYRGNTVHGVSGRMYSMKIVSDGKEYHSTSTMPGNVPIDSVLFEWNQRSNGYRVICKFKDPADVLNFYKLQLFSNDIANIDSSDIRIIADGFADGQELGITYRSKLALGDTVTVKLESIDKPTYDFYRTLPNVSGGLRSYLSAPPANPVSNIDNGAIGYFAAYSVSTLTTVVHL